MILMVVHLFYAVFVVMRVVEKFRAIEHKRAFYIAKINIAN
jgi:hypothetical protein